MPKLLTLMLSATLISGYSLFGAETKTLTVSSLHFVPFNTNVPVLTDENLARWPDFPEGWAGTGWVAPLQLPEGAVLSALTLSYCATPNTNPGMTVYLRTKCSNGENCAPTEAFLLSSSPEECRKVTIGVDSPSPRIENRENTYYLRADFSNGGTGKLVDVRVSYTIPLLGIPASPSFTDVPPNHLFYRFIEHIYAAGITAGCGGSRFCPEAPITRGEVAVMISNATTE